MVAIEDKEKVSSDKHKIPAALEAFELIGSKVKEAITEKDSEKHKELIMDAMDAAKSTLTICRDDEKQRASITRRYGVLLEDPFDHNSAFIRYRYLYDANRSLGRIINVIELLGIQIGGPNHGWRSTKPKH